MLCCADCALEIDCAPQVVEWANKEFYREVDTLKPDESISLAKPVCRKRMDVQGLTCPFLADPKPGKMTVCAGLHAPCARGGSSTGEARDILFKNSRPLSGNKDETDSGGKFNSPATGSVHECPRAGAHTYIHTHTHTLANVGSWQKLATRMHNGQQKASHASASTWSLERLDALAAEIKDLVMASVKDWEQQSFAASSAKLANASHAGTGAGAAPYEWDARDAAAAAAAAGGAVGGTATSVSAASKVNASASTSSATEEAGAQASSVDTGRTAASLDQYRSGSPTTASSAPSDFLQLPPGLFKAFPGQVVSAINEVLYERHGYAPCNRWGNIRLCARCAWGLLWGLLRAGASKPSSVDELKPCRQSIGKMGGSCGGSCALAPASTESNELRRSHVLALLKGYAIVRRGFLY
eukprot:1158036-Pelagomonas_calceolata.AAC.2